MKNLRALLITVMFVASFLIFPAQFTYAQVCTTAPEGLVSWWDGRRLRISSQGFKGRAS